ncbi:2OG-Fe(II) oxygenase [Bryobacter aggregatus]|uniref:2OG-Fe(II) oxygenase n=1 Tax=Bryobacter aggregatus TaxID=360054 RepID=UPI0004E14FFE|nr:2OG-Fe(II) oxygenase [Bryobacter aggregatus]
MSWKRQEIAELILARLQEAKWEAHQEFRLPRTVKSFIVDDLLPAELTTAILSAFPPVEKMVLKHHLGELKYVGVQMNHYAPLLEETIYAFQDPRVVQCVGEICGLDDLIPDEHLYAGGISAMEKGHYLNPHLDNSHDFERKRYRALNLLYYASPGWCLENGGNLELWDSGPKGKPRTIESRCNRLAVMQTDKTSWHSVSEVLAAGTRRCISNYFFTINPVDGQKDYHVTSFRGRPEEKFKDLLMQGDNALRQAVKETLGESVFKNKHVYKKD